jgi:hypothetical protein
MRRCSSLMQVAGQLETGGPLRESLTYRAHTLPRNNPVVDSVARDLHSHLGAILFRIEPVFLQELVQTLAR